MSFFDIPLRIIKYVFKIACFLCQNICSKNKLIYVFKTGFSFL